MVLTTGSTEELIRAWTERGFARLPCRLRLESRDELITAANGMIAENASAQSPFVATAHLTPAGRGAIARLARSKGLLDVLQQILGPDLIFWGSTLFHKPAHTTVSAPWHQDGETWPVVPPVGVNVWFALTNYGAGNGGLRYLPGSHRYGLLGLGAGLSNIPSQFLRDGEVKQELLDYPELASGEGVVHHCLTVHSSCENASPTARTAIALYFMPASAHYLRKPHGNIPAKFFDRPIWVVRGSNVGGNELLSNASDD
jgi:hypothetical protein